MSPKHAALLALLSLLLLVGACGPTETSGGTSTEAVRLYKEAIDEDYLGNRDRDAALAKMEEGIELEPSYTQLRRDLAYLLMQRGLDRLFEKHQYQAQIDDLEHKSDSMQDQSERAETLARAESLKRRAQGIETELRTDLAKARQHFLLVHRDWPHDPTVPYYLGHVSVGLERYDDARTFYEDALDMGNLDEGGRTAIRKAIQALDQAIAHREALDED